MARKLRAITGGKNGTVPENIEALYAQKVQQRIKACGEEIDAALTKHNCALSICLKIGEQTVALNQIVSLPGVMMINAKP